MSFDDMPKLPPPLLPEAAAYAARVLERSKQVQAESRTVIDVPYGDDYWQKVDFYLPDEDAGGGLPVLCFIHGGAWRHGYKEWMGFMAPPVIRHPAVFVSVSYRLAPDTKFPDIAEDCFDALALVHRTVVQFGGDADRIFIGGHSAGAHLAALVTLRRDRARARGLPDDVIKACFPVSGLYDLGANAEIAGGVLEIVRPLMFDDPDDSEAASPLNFVAGNTTPFFVTYGSDDLPEVLTSSERFIDLLAGQPGPVESHIWSGYNHFDASEGLADDENVWVQKLTQWMESSPS